ncbi:sensor histidine kinase [Paenibacillus piscarius]|uniref:sensor histidine kinase n=1 Tax=Paenibacillus piscarius TaxID=1089681 RepID=UPI001EE82B63|nr:histidine kinase [Paenibacillus piscarius]
MTYKQIKWMILLIPTFTVGAWEYIRHQFLLPYISMDLGNWLTPLIVYLVSMTLLNKMFHMLERMQKELEIERNATAVLEAREQLANEIHDGIAQSLFLLSVKADRLEEHVADKERHLQDVHQIRKTIQEVNRYVRQAIADLKYEPMKDKTIWSHESIESKLKKMVQDIPIQITVTWSIQDNLLSPKEKIELLACVREAVVNMEKHSAANQGWITGDGNQNQLKITVKDNGRGFAGNPFMLKDRYGLNIMKERVAEMDWRMNFYRDRIYTILELVKEGERN